MHRNGRGVVARAVNIKEGRLAGGGGRIGVSVWRTVTVMHAIRDRERERISVGREGEEGGGNIKVVKREWARKEKKKEERRSQLKDGWVSFLPVPTVPTIEK